MTSTTPEQVAQWMLDQLEREKYLYQNTVVFEIAEQFGESFTTINDNGNMIIRQISMTGSMSAVWTMATMLGESVRRVICHAAVTPRSR